MENESFFKKFKPLTINDQSSLNSFFKKYPETLAIYSFASLISWNAVYSYSFYLIEETLLICFNFKEKNYLLQPVGIFPKHIQHLILSYIQDSQLEIVSVTEKFLKKNKEFCSFFEIKNERDYANYLYLAKDLSTLFGRHYEKKRNLIAQAKKLYNWTVEPLTTKCYPHCIKVLEEIGNRDKEKLQDELKALHTMLINFRNLDLKGIVININNQPEAFSIYGRLNDHTADIYFEKANREFKGLYQVINQETAKAILNENYTLINREEDLGINGLRQAKTSYFPIELISSYSLIPIIKSNLMKSFRG